MLKFRCGTIMQILEEEHFWQLFPNIKYISKSWGVDVADTKLTHKNKIQNGIS